jgi:transposase
MLFVTPLSEPEQVTLQEMHQHHPMHWTRMRAHAILLSASGYRVQEIAAIYGVCRQTVSSWLKAWARQGVVGLLDQARSGRPRKLSAAEEAQVLAWLEAEPRSIKRVLAELEKRCGRQVSMKTVKRLCKRAGLVWKRVRQSLKDKRDPQAFAASVERLAELIEHEATEAIELYYFDESGFTLVPAMAYAWQPCGETIELPTSHSKRLNVLGFMNRASDVHSYVFEGTIDTAVVIACFDEFAKTREKPTVVVLDNASLHTSEAFEANRERWHAAGLQLEFLAPYSPELNLIEILWRKIKYEWLPFSAYESFASLRDALFKILRDIGTEYKIAFS